MQTTQLPPQYIKDVKGASLMSPKEHKKLLIEQLEMADDVALYDEAMKAGTDGDMLFSDYLKIREKIFTGFYVVYSRS